MTSTFSPAVLFDLRGTQAKTPVSFHGGGEYARSVLGRFGDRGLDDDLLLLLRDDLPENQYTEYARKVVGDDRVVYFDRKSGATDFPPSLHTYYSPLPYTQNVETFQQLRRIGTIHGLRPIECPTDRYEMRCRPLTNWPKIALKRLFVDVYKARQADKFRLMARQFDEIVVPSEHTKFALVKLLGEEGAAPIRVLYSPPTELILNAGSENSPSPEALGLKAKSYMMIVSGKRYEKNACRALIAIRAIQDSAPKLMANLDIAVAGGVPRLKRKERPRNIVELPYLPVDQLVGLYKHCRLFIYPSLNEGFGYPPIEAMSCGAQVVSSSACSMQELLAGRCQLFAPMDTDEIATRVLAVLSKPDDATDTIRDSIDPIIARQSSDLDALVDMLRHRDF